MTADPDSASVVPATGQTWLSPQDVCNLLGIPRQTFYQWRAKHMGPPAYRFGKLIRIDRADFNTWLAGHAEPGFSVSNDDAQKGQ